MMDGMSTATAPRRWPLAVAAGAVLLVLIAIFIAAHHRNNSHPAAVNGGNGGLLSRPAGGPTTPPALPGPVSDADLARAKQIAASYVQAVHSLDYRTLTPGTRLAATRPFMTTAFYSREQARSSVAGNSSDTSYLAQLRSQQVRVYVTVRSAAVASGDGGGTVHPTRVQMRVYYTTTTVSATSPDGIVSPETPTTLRMTKTQQGWLVDGADGT
jgi:hypothetical protein